MRVLIVENRQTRAATWARHLRMQGAEVTVTHDEAAAIAALNAGPFEVMLLDLMLTEGAALAIADYAGYRRPDLRVVCLTDAAVFSDGSIFRHCANACAFLGAETRVEDIAALVEHHGRAA